MPFVGPLWPSVVVEWLWSTARLSIRLGDAEAAKADLARLDDRGVHTPHDAAERLGIRAGLVALDGQTAAAIRLYVAALEAFRDLGEVLVEAQTALEMATVLDPTIPEVVEAVKTARQTLTRLRARAFLDQLDAAVQRRSVATPEPADVETIHADR